MMTEKTIKNIVRSCGITPGEKVLIHFWGEDRVKHYANSFLAAVAGCGATPFLLQQSRSINQSIFSVAKESCYANAYFDFLSSFDTVLDIFAYQPIVLGTKLEEGQMKLYCRYISRTFYALMKAKRFLQIRIPTEENAQEAGIEAKEYVRRMDAAYAIDYSALRKCCENAVQELKNYRGYRIFTGEDCCLELNTDGRQWNIDAGDGDWPCGEVYIAPLENQSNGSIYFERLFLENVGTFENVKLTAENGALIGSDNETIDQFIRNMPQEERVICELGFGMNPGVSTLCGYKVLDEKMQGTFHIGIGANTMFGGENQANRHLDLVNGGKFTVLKMK